MYNFSCPICGYNDLEVLKMGLLYCPDCYSLWKLPSTTKEPKRKRRI